MAIVGSLFVGVAPNKRRVGRRVVSSLPQPPAPAIVGFVRNGSANTSLKTMLANRTGTIEWIGDSTGQGAGGGVTANGTQSGGPAQLADARRYRPSVVVAGLATADGYAMVDNAIVGDNGAGGDLPAYDPRFFLGDGWVLGGGQEFAGGSFLNAGPSTTPTQLTVANCDTFEIVLYGIQGAVANITRNGAQSFASLTAVGGTVSGNRVTVTAANVGFTKIIAKAANVGDYTVEIVSVTPTVLVRSIDAYNSTQPAIRILNESSGGSTAGHHVAQENNWKRLDSLIYDAPKLSIINLGLNDMTIGQSTNTTVYKANLGKLVDTAKLSGDVLIVAPNAANPNSGSTYFASVAMQDAYHTAMAEVAAAKGVSFCDIRTAFGGWDVTGTRTADGIVHPNRAYYADIGAYVWSCVKSMAQAVPSATVTYAGADITYLSETVTYG